MILAEIKVFNWFFLKCILWMSRTSGVKPEKFQHSHISLTEREANAIFPKFIIRGCRPLFCDWPSTFLHPLPLSFPPYCHKCKWVSAMCKALSMWKNIFFVALINLLHVSLPSDTWKTKLLYTYFESLCINSKFIC